MAPCFYDDFYCLPPLAEAVDKRARFTLLLLLKTLLVARKQLALDEAMSTSEGSMI